MKERITQARYLYHNNSLDKNSLIDKQKILALDFLPRKLKILEQKIVLRRKSEQRYQMRYK